MRFITIIFALAACVAANCPSARASEEAQKRTEFNDLYKKGQAKEALEKLAGCREPDSLQLIAKVAAGEPNQSVATQALDMLMGLDDVDSNIAQIIARVFQGATSFDRKLAYAEKLSGMAFKYHTLAVMVQYVAGMDYPESSKEALDRIQKEIDSLSGAARKDMGLLSKIRGLEKQIEDIKKNPEPLDAKHGKYESLVASIGKLAGTTFKVDRKFPKFIAAWWGTQQADFLNQDGITIALKRKAAAEAKKQAAGK
ncbi:MAG: hypothetical protein HY291_19950 [Planctomycetes bacterium]|nr:hypothetical protein [Planctomycetota bacterium]